MSADVLTTLARLRGSAIAERVEGKRWDGWLLLVVLSLVGLGLVMLYSASAVRFGQLLGDPMLLVKSQLQKFVLGLIMMFGAMKLDYRWYRRLIYPLVIVTVLMLVLVAIPGIGTMRNGSRRWFSLGGMSFQPAEVAKFVSVMYLAYSVSKKGERMRSFMVGFVPHLAVIGGLVSLLMLQPDFGSSVILLTMMMIMLFVSGARFAYLFGFTLLGAVGAFVAISSRAYRMKRIMAFLDPWAYRQDIGYQISESLIAIGTSGVQGRGLGGGTGKLGYVPELWNDFIGTIIAEELGLFGVIGLVALFTMLVWRGLRIATRSVDAFGAYLAFGFTTLFALQATANLCVVTGLLPNKGLTLPFVSFGGSSLIMAMFAVGVMLNISRGEEDDWEERQRERKRRKSQQRLQRRREAFQGSAARHDR